jgi:hypothetical protein
MNNDLFVSYEYTPYYYLKRIDCGIDVLCSSLLLHLNNKYI